VLMKGTEKRLEKNRRIPVSIDFNELITACEQSTDSTHFFIDITRSTIIRIDESKDIGSQTKVRQMGKNKRYLKIPTRDISDEAFVMETFLYEPRINASEEISPEMLQTESGARQFHQMLASQPSFKQQWLDYRAAALRNALLSWLCDNSIELTNQQLLPPIEIKELTAEEIHRLPDEIKDFKPYACLRCHNNTGMKARIFSINISPENRLIEQETSRIMKEQFGISHHSGWSGGDQEFLTASQCPQCGCEEIFWDY
jgi:hypothetical protein